MGECSGSSWESGSSSASETREENPLAEANLKMCLNVIMEAKNTSSISLVSHQFITWGAEGTNYTGVITKTTLFIRDQDGNETKEIYIIKEDRHVGPIQGQGIFKQEIDMYSNILPKMESVIEDSGLSIEEPLWCDYIGCRQFHTLVLRDLCQEGFTLPNRREGLTHSQALMTVKNLAKFHALSKNLLEKGMISKSNFEAHYTSRPEVPPVVILFYRGGLKQLVQAMRSWPPEWNDVTDRVAVQQKVVLQKMKDLHDTCYDSRFEVLNHGDVWSCNLMFKHRSNEPVAMRFIDYQVCHVHSLAWDLIHLLYSSLQPMLRNSVFDDLLSAYHSSLMHYMTIFRCSGPIPSLDQVKKEVERLAYYSFLVTTINFPLATTEKSKAFSLTKLLQSHQKPRRRFPFHKSIYRNNRIMGTVGQDLLEMVRKGII